MKLAEGMIAAGWRKGGGKSANSLPATGQSAQRAATVNHIENERRSMTTSLSVSRDVALQLLDRLLVR